MIGYKVMTARERRVLCCDAERSEREDALSWLGTLGGESVYKVEGGAGGQASALRGIGVVLWYVVHAGLGCVPQ